MRLFEKLSLAAGTNPLTAQVDLKVSYMILTDDTKLGGKLFF